MRAPISGIGLVLSTVAGVLCVWSAPAWSADVIDLSMGYYKDDNRLTVNTPSVSITKDLPTKTTLNIKYTYETFEKEAPSNASDAVTGATTVSGGTGGGYDDVRKEIVGGASQQIGPVSLAIGGFYGNENDYLSQAYTLGSTLDLFQKNLTVTFVYGKTADQIEKLDEPNDDFPKHKDNATYTVAATQVLTPRFLVTGGYSLSHVEGFQSLPTRKVLAIQTYVQGVPVGPIYEEKHPDLRDRHTAFLRFRQYLLSRTALDLNLSYYTDSWDVDGFMAEPRVEHYLTDHIAVRLRYRFYSQTAAYFYQPLYFAADVTNDSLKTADVRLRNYNTNTVGIALRLLGDTAKDWSVFMSYDRYFETNDGVQANVVQATLSIPY